MSNIHTTWVPKKRNVVFSLRPPDIPEWVYTLAMTAKKQYNEDWEYWVWNVSKDHNCSQAIAEDACIRGIKKEILRIYHIYGDHIGKWFEEFLDMDSVFRMVKHPEYVNKLGD